MNTLILEEKIHDLCNFKKIIKSMESPTFIKNNKNIEYANIAVSFDIETSSFYENGEKRAIKYLWSFCYYGKCFIGRTWDEFIQACKDLQYIFSLGEYKRMIIYVHNLSFEFQFMRKLFTWVSVFSIDDRTPAKALCTYGIEFRCSYILSGYSLAKLSDQLTRYKVKKMVGDLDYSLIRNEKTVLTEKELLYSIHDVLVVVAYIQETIENNGNILKIPLTKTGFVRNLCRENCLYKGDDKSNKKYHAYRKMIMSNKLDEDKYKQLKRAFMGGFTHSNALHTGIVVDNVGSFDETSAYPARMVAEQFPTGTSELIEIKSFSEFERKINCYCCIFEAEFYGLEATVLYENYISKSRCYVLEDYIENNGRIVEAKHLKITLTEVDFKIIYKWYKWDDLKIFNFRIYNKAYLPKDFILTILDLYGKKTMLKGVVDKEVEYLKSKENINSMFGMAVTDIVQELVTYENNTWGKELPDITDCINRYNKSPKRFLCYEWGVWTTAYNRYMLFKAIEEFKDDYVYSDTDSVKGINYDRHRKFIEEENERIVNQLKKAMDYHNLPFELTCPKTIKGVKKQLGVWDFEGVYEQFKTLGAKRYMIKEQNALLLNPNSYNGTRKNCKETVIDGKKYLSFDYNLTVSGVNKGYAIPYLVENFTNPFDAFSDNLYIPSQYSGKLTHTYCDDEVKGYVTDYQGNKAYYNEKSFVHLEPAEYTVNMSDKYLYYLNKIMSNKLDNKEI